MLILIIEFDLFKKTSVRFSLSGCLKLDFYRPYTFGNNDKIQLRCQIFI